MAWYAELRRRHWYCINGMNMITLYKQKLFEDWYQSLSEEEKEAYKEYKHKESERVDRELNTSLMKLAVIGASLVGRSPYL